MIKVVYSLKNMNSMDLSNSIHDLQRPNEDETFNIIFL